MAKAVIPTQNNFQPRSFQQGFNYGYRLAKQAPDLLNKLLPSLQASNEFLKAIQLGKEQYDKEQKNKIHQKEQAPRKEDRERDLGKDGIDRDR